MSDIEYSFITSDVIRSFHCIIFSISLITHIKPVFFHLLFYQDISCYLLTYITDANFRT